MGIIQQELAQVKQVHNETILNILRKFIPHETVLCDDRDPPWFNAKIKSLVHEKILHLNGLEVIDVTVA